MLKNTFPENLIWLITKEYNKIHKIMAKCTKKISMGLQFSIYAKKNSPLPS